MTHLDEGRLQSLVDGELPGSESRAAWAHVEACAACREAVEATKARGRAVTAALGVLDAPPPVTRVRARVTRAAARRRAPRGWLGLPAQALSRAAVVTLLLAGGAAAAALPGSPVRAWIGGGEEPAEPATESAAAAPAEVGIRVAPSEGRLRIHVDGLPSGAGVEATREPGGGTAAVYAPDGARFRSGDGVLEVTAPQGPVRIHLPAEVEAVLSVDGRVWLESGASGLTTSVPPVERDGRRLLFRVP